MTVIMIWIMTLIVSAVGLVIAGAIVFLSALGPMDGLLGLLLAGFGFAVFMAAGVVMSLKDAEERLQSLLRARKQ